ncbi:MAG: hypothetical protein EA391_05380 [Balneolaceae bacterium]|nr:MAG: hypothetical protein EA391_05380 [Balneolaceae bacterium]
MQDYPTTKSSLGSDWYKTTIAALLLICTSACSGTSGFDDSQCNMAPFFDHLPVNQEAIESVIVLGQFNPPGDVAPRPQTGLRLHPDTITPVYAPGDIVITEIERSTWLSSPNREGHSDYTIVFEIEGCRSITGNLEHMDFLIPELENELSGARCSSYSTESETIQSCQKSVNIRKTSGEILGQAGGFLGALDFDMYNRNHRNEFVNQGRLHDGFRHAICPQTLFAEPLRSVLLGKVGRGGVWRTAEPVCGTMEIDVAGTAQGLWVIDGRDVTLSGETHDLFFSLALDDILPHKYSVLVTAHEMFMIDGIGAAVIGFEMEQTGRINIKFSNIPNDGTIYCYIPATDSPMHHAIDNFSVFVAYNTDGKVTIERKNHYPGGSPCLTEDPENWAFTSISLKLMR